MKVFLIPVLFLFLAACATMQARSSTPSILDGIGASIAQIMP